MEKIKPLLPSLREKKRYVAFEIVSEKPVNIKQASSVIFDSARKYVGVKGLALMGLIVLDEKFKKNKGILKVNVKHVNTLKACFCLAKEIDSQPIILKSLGVSGVLQKIDKFTAS